MNAAKIGDLSLYFHAATDEAMIITNWRNPNGILRRVVLSRWTRLSEPNIMHKCET
jgi:hypothetical protein